MFYYFSTLLAVSLSHSFSYFFQAYFFISFLCNFFIFIFPKGYLLCSLCSVYIFFYISFFFFRFLSLYQNIIDNLVLSGGYQGKPEEDCWADSAPGPTGRPRSPCQRTAWWEGLHRISDWPDIRPFLCPLSGRISGFVCRISGQKNFTWHILSSKPLNIH